jgi:hypothetical protein
MRPLALAGWEHAVGSQLPGAGEIAAGCRLRHAGQGPGLRAWVGDHRAGQVPGPVTVPDGCVCR